MATLPDVSGVNEPTRDDSDQIRVKLMFYVGVPGLTAMLFGLNQAGMARVLPSGWGIPYWLGITAPLWLLLDISSRMLDRVVHRLQPHRWLLLLGGALIAMALFSFYVPVYVSLFSKLLPEGTHYMVNPAFPEAFLDLRRFVAYSGVPIYWIALALFFAHYFHFPPYLVDDARRPRAHLLPLSEDSPPAEPVINEFGLPARTGFRALIPYHLGLDLVSLSSEDHYVRVVTERGNTLVRYRFSDALNEVRGLHGLQAHRSHWVSVAAIDRVIAHGKTYRLLLRNGTEIPVSRTNIGLLRAAGIT